MKSHWQIARELTKESKAFVVVTLVSARGHVPQDPGAKAIVTTEGLAGGTVGGGKVEAKAIVFARELLEKKTIQPQLLTWNLTRDVGMTCGGESTFLFEIHNPTRWKIALFGAGHVAQALTRTLISMDCHVTCVDSRPEWLEKLPESEKITPIQDRTPPDVVARMTENHFFVVMTQGHGTDVPVLVEIFKQFPNAPYIGVMGSDVKALKIRNDLKANGIDANLIEKLHSPIGLPIGGNTPPEIAISVAAELLQERADWMNFSTPSLRSIEGEL